MSGILEYGPEALIVRCDGVARRRGFLREIERAGLRGLREATPGQTEVLLEFAGRRERDACSGEVARLLAESEELGGDDARLVECEVIYDGPDLADLARRQGISVPEVVARHAAPVYEVELIGFSPGFPYLGPLDPLLRVPRRATPRPNVPPGSVAIGGQHTGIYSIASPGGWWLIGRTSRELFDLSKAEGDGSAGAFLLRQGDRVKFRPVG